MLQRAASSAYSWWWASHIRTKQSKWLEQNLQDMDDKVGSMLSIIDEDGDSFAKRAEMYYRKRPELVHLVEESFRAYRALAERYDHISRDLQSANRTIATVYPEKVHFTALDDDDDEEREDSFKKLVNQENATMPKSNIPKVPTKNFKPLPTLRTKRAQLQQQLKRTSSSAKAVPCSGLSKGEALEEIDKLQKGILALQTEKEFVKSIYENAIAKYLEIENRISEMQVKVCGLQDEFGIGTVIEDNEARKLMATTALNSCREMLNRLQEKQESLVREASMEQGKIKKAHKRLQALKDEFYVDELSDKQVLNEINKLPSENQTGTNLDHVAVKSALQSLEEKMKELEDEDGNESLTVANLVDRIDDMVDAVVNLETAVASSSAMVQRLKSEADEVQDNVQALEKDEDKISVGSNIIRQKVVELEVEMVRFQNLNQALENQNTGLVSHFIQASDSLEQLAEKVEKFNFDEMVDIAPWNVDGKDGDVHMLSAKNNLKISEKPKKGDKFLDVVSQLLSSSSGKHQAINSLDAGKEVVNSESVGQDHETMASLEDELEIITEDSVQFEVSQREFPAENEEQSITPETANKGSRRDEAPFHDHDINESFTEHQSGSLEDENIEIVDSTCRLYEDEDPKQDEKKKTCSNSSQGEGKEEKLGPESDAAFVENRGSRWRRLAENSEGELDWRRLFVSGLEDREKFLVDEYTSVIKTLKEARRKLSEVEKKSREGLNEQASKMKEIMHANSLKDREIESLRRTLSMLKMSSGEKEGITLQDTLSQPALREGAVPKETELLSSELAQRTANDAIENTVDETQPAIMEIILNEEPHFVSSIEEKFRSDLDEMLGENLEFWLRFCTSVHQIQKFQSSIEDLQMEAAELMESKKQGTNSRNIESLKADAKPIYKHLKEIQAELHLWLQHNSLLKEEVENRHSSLSDIQEDITRLSNATEDSELSEYQAAKFQGEVANMKQENDKVADELQSCIRRVKNLHTDTDRTLRILNEEFGLTELERKHSRSRIPLRTFLFGVRLKKPKHSFFRCISPALQKQYSDLASQFPPPR